MSSINTNIGAMVALDTLKGINKNLGQVQNEISTGKSINSAKDNAAIWSIATVMETDVAGFEQISNSLNLGSATVGVARVSSEAVVGELQSIRDNIIAAQESNVDQAKIQTDINESIAQITSTVAAAQFNGLNLLDNGGSINILSSLNRASDGSVTTGQISVTGANLTTNATGVTAGGAVTGAATFTAAQDASGGSALTNSTAIQVDAAGGNQTYAFTIDGEALTYETSAGQDAQAIATGIAGVINAAVTAGDITAGLTATATAGGAVQFSAASGTADYSLTGTGVTSTETQAVGALAGLDTIDVTTDAAGALTAINTILDSAIDAAAQFGSKQGRIDNQIDFVSSLGDSLKAGVSTLTDANLEEASARLQALQVQQQLGVQALSIANQAPQALLGLFR
ncbi:flagellin [Algimonas ampicilliniresistens]|jgi:flagellin|uniref:Flagellin n=1 Tax=Algimonas ampicilliniresistens TaxID=1298735 RepID=A0ABQ5VBA1_9PROT|nr:flagellin [Algimonas ampicilliniresistens]GLQ24357.1 flagellin [Algimonas ampicilliniresistens]